MAKDKESLDKSRQLRERIIQKLEGKPIESIMVHDKSNKADDPSADRRAKGLKDAMNTDMDNYIETQGLEGEVGNMDIYRRSFKQGYEGSRRVGQPLSRFPQNICRRVMKFYTETGQIVVDPFAGHNSRMEAAFLCKLHYYGQDLSKEFMSDNYKVRDRLLSRATKQLFKQVEPTIIDLTEGDSRSLPWADDFGDFTITSPPYWDVEYYGDEVEQLGYGQKQTYEEFLAGLAQVAKENYRVLKKGAYCVWFINDFRKDGIFYDFHGDTKNLLIDAGFVQRDVIITDFGPSLQAVFLANSYKYKILPKRHEFGIVVQKPL